MPLRNLSMQDECGGDCAMKLISALDPFWYILITFIVMASFGIGVIIAQERDKKAMVTRDLERAIVEVEYKGHQYFSYRGSLVHNPDCHCRTNSSKRNGD